MLGAAVAGPPAQYAPDAPFVAGAGPDAALPISAGVERVWLGESFWANRLQDWRLRDGEIQCVVQDPGAQGLCTVGLLPYEVGAGGPFRVETELSLLTDDGGGGLGGFLVGAGSGQLDWRAAALVQRGSGEGGGLLAVFETDGRCRFRDHTDEDAPRAFAALPAVPLAPEGAAQAPRPGATVRLVLEGVPTTDGTYRLRLQALDPVSGRRVAGCELDRVAAPLVRGGVSLASSSYPDADGARWAFRDVRAAGDGVGVYPDRTFGPVAGVLYSLSSETLHPDGPRDGAVLKMTAQLLPVGDDEPGTVRLEAQRAGQASSYEAVQTAELDRRSYTAHFRVAGWDATRDRDVRVVWTDGSGADHVYEAHVRRDPTDADDLRVALFSCVIPAAHGLDREPMPLAPPETRWLGRYTEDNVYFPHGPLALHAAAHDPDLVVFCGDQIYEASPTLPDEREDPYLDYLYKWLLWVWSFRELTRSRPAVVLIDDHDVYHANIWGEGGKKAPDEPFGWNEGGYIGTADFVNTVQRTQCGHDPDPYDPAPVDRGISVYYGAFRYGGVDIALLEDRKFKTAPVQGHDMDVHTPALLGGRQEAFLSAWGRLRPGEPKLAVTQTLFACLQTSPEGQPLLDFDSNGYPPLARDRAVALLRDAGALVLAGDQHLGSLVRLGLDGFDDGPIQFAGPAGGATWVRWFEPADPLPNAREGVPHTGDFRDAFGNRVRVLAVANPQIPYAEYREARPGRNQKLYERALKREGYGLVRVDKQAGQFVVECWPYDVDPSAPGAAQFAGWPVAVPFAEAGRASR